MFTAMAIDNPGTTCEEITQSWPTMPEFSTFEEAVAWCRSTGRNCGQIFDRVGLCGGWSVSGGAWRV